MISFMCVLSWRTECNADSCTTKFLETQKLPYQMSIVYILTKKTTYTVKMYNQLHLNLLKHLEICFQ